MYFADEAEINVRAGKGGDGSASFRREKYVPRGGPDGGNGGRGGNIIFEANRNVNTLVNFMSKKHYKAPHGVQGLGQKCFGKNGEDLVLEVPVGTLIYEKKEGDEKILIADMTKHGEQKIIANGGLGGKGNANFTSSTRQAPDFAELGEPGEEKELRLELKLIADAALVGYPGVGKSILIARISNARPKIADYPFTTLIPNLGVVQIGNVDFVVADIPGLIEGAHEGKGLGIDFLKHIERTKIIVHLLDVTHENLRQEYKNINKELKSFSKELAKKPQILVVNKIDATISEVIDEVNKEFKKENPLFISAVSGEGINDFLYRLKDEIVALRRRDMREHPTPLPSKERKIFRPHLALPNTRQFEIVKEGERFRITGKRIEQIAVMTNMSQKGGVHRVHDILKKIGAQKELLRLGIKEGDNVLIGSHVFEFKTLD